MKDKKFKAFSVIRLIFAALLIAEALFLIYCAVLNIFFYEPHINRMTARILTCAPFIISFIYSLISVFEKSRSNSKTLIAGITGAVISFAAVAALSFWPLEIFLLVAMAVFGVILAAHGLAKAKITFSYGIICLSVMYFNLFTLPRLFYDYSGMDILEIMVSIIFITVVCAFMIADLVLAAKLEKTQGHIEAKTER